jgi:uncharacterized membrane protein
MTKLRVKSILNHKKQLASNRSKHKGMLMSGKSVYFPHKNWVYVLLGLVVLVILIIIFSGLISFTFSAAGDSAFIIILVGSLVGSFINIPLYKAKSNHPLVREEYVRWMGITYRIPRVSLGETNTQVDVNVGGALIPAAMSVFLITDSSVSIVLYSLIGVLAVTIVTHLVARPVRGVGITTPPFIPPIAAAVVAIILSPAHPAVVAYVSGTLGALIGADLLNLGKIPDLGAPIASIGGAGTFDGVFVTGIIAVLLAAL